ncbi:hypothetical protein [Sphingobacterium sp. BIGb0165]|uniref:hypothetical protein n=1 Tax=Sphingobacterium sp. BIGb0165 TaxID=2940615 RepID=UPI0021695E6C|nr:hypothetical protein [Sphingobacterium sp. BIGb0165]MCS4229284.1 hypothetical protein [Sphingobacterium sp. BIGb0165]
MKDLLMLLSAFFLASVSGCGKSDINSPPYPPGKKKSYIQNFISTDTLTILERVNTKIIKNELDFNGSSLVNHAENNGKVFSLENNIMLFASLEWKKGFKDGNFDYAIISPPNEKYVQLSGDTHYNAEPIFGLHSAPIAIIDTLESIKITSDRAFGDDLPAGANLNRLFKVYFEDPYLVIANNYKQPEGGYRLAGINYNIFPHIITGGRLDEINFVNKPFIGNTYMCILSQLPKEQGNYRFKISIKTKNGKIIENTSRPISIYGS